MRHPKKNRVPIIDKIPREILASEILTRVAASSVADISSIKLSCKELREIAEDAEVYRHACLDKFPIVAWDPLCHERQNFLNKCRESANPEYWYREALLEFFNKIEFHSAKQSLDKASKSGHVGALYAKSILLLFSGDDGLKRKGIKLIGKMRKSGNLKRKLRLCRTKLMGELRQMWVKNPLVRVPPVICTAHGYRRTNKWAGEEEEEDDDDEDCEGCGADREIEFISSKI